MVSNPRAELTNNSPLEIILFSYIFHHSGRSMNLKISYKTFLLKPDFMPTDKNNKL